ncbi:hypothetical protein ACFL4E_00700 [Candidatus Omnitrophota bacterium]
MKIISVLIILAVSLSFLSGCGRTGQYGTIQGIEKVTPLKDILSSPEKYEGKTVKVEGKIVEECPTGCWFNLADDGGIIYVDTNPGEFAIPQEVGKKASAEGTVVLKDGNVSIAGKGVEIK